TSRGQTFGCVHRKHSDCDRTAFRLAAGRGLAARASQSIGGYRSLLSVSWRSVACSKRLACIAHKSLEICERCRLWQRNSPATPENSAAFLERRVSNRLLQFIYFKM